MFTGHVTRLQEIVRVSEAGKEPFVTSHAVIAGVHVNVTMAMARVMPLLACAIVLLVTKGVLVWKLVLLVTMATTVSPSACAVMVLSVTMWMGHVTVLQGGLGPSVSKVSDSLFKSHALSSRRRNN